MMPAKTITVGEVERPKLSRDGRTMVVSIPISMRRTGGRKKVVTPANAAPWSPPPARVDNTIVKALGARPSLARHAGTKAVRERARSRQGREDQRGLSLPRASPDAALPDDHRGHSCRAGCRTAWIWRSC